MACFMSFKDKDGCGEFMGQIKLESLNTCERDVSAHLRRFHLSKEHLTEYELILLRAGCLNMTTQQIEKMLVCPRHRGNLGLYWRERAVCQYPQHKGKKEGAKCDRAFTTKMVKEVNEVFGVIIPIGSPICNSCRKSHSKKLKQEWKWLLEAHTDDTEEDNQDEQAALLLPRKSKQSAMEAIAEFPLGTPLAFSHVADPQWTPGQWRAQEHEDNYDSDEEPVQENTLRVYNEAMAQIAALSGLKVIEPLTFRLQTEWEVATKREKMLCEEILNEACQAICKVIAPNACEQLLKAFRRSLSTDTELGALTTAYKHAPTKNLKTQILSIYAFQYSSEELKTIHAPFEKLSDRQIKKARAHAKAVGAGMAVEKKTFHRVRIDITKLNHFLSYIDQPYFYQDVAYGIRKIKLESGEQLVMPNVVRTVGRSTMIELYLKKCRDEEFHPLATSTLYRILKVREASQRKSLQGLDNIAASGADGFETMQKVVEILEQVGANPDWCDNVKKNLKSGKRYLKTEYRAHCRDDTSPCADHCRQHALSDMKCSELQKLCDHEHCVTCDNCEALKATLLSILTQIQSPELDFYSEEQQKDLLYDARQARDTILQWKAHILRAENQDMAKKDVLKSLPLDTVFVLMDWAMKFTQMKYREKQSEWYGKRGMSWHVSCVVSKPSTTDDLQIASYVHLLDNCTQDWYVLSAILILLLKTLKQTRPHINKAYLRSDGAGCYHNNNLITAINDLGKQTGIKVIRYDFSEPQFGKDICDRIISPLKGAIRRYCNEGHDIMSSSDMHEALKARPVKGTTAAVCDLEDAVPQEIKVSRIKNFSAFHNFSYDTKGLCMSKAYGIGSGKLVTWSELNVQSQSGVTLSVLDDHGFFKMEPRLMKLSQDTSSSNTESKDEEILLECKEASCSLSFTTLDELQDHMNFGQHKATAVKNQESLYDKLRREWAFKFSTLSDKVEKKQAFNETPVPSNDSSLEAAGWALQKPRSSNKFSDKVKSYLTAKFDAGVTGRKADPTQVSQDMRKARNDDGSRKFTREEWLTKVQIKSFFSRLSASRRKQQAMQEDDNDDDVVEEELEFEEEEIRDEQMKDLLSQLGVEHPITYDGYDICASVKSDSLSRFNCKILKSICEHFELPYKSRDTKATLLGKIGDMVKDCSC